MIVYAVFAACWWAMWAKPSLKRTAVNVKLSLRAHPVSTRTHIPLISVCTSRDHAHMSNNGPLYYSTLWNSLEEQAMRSFCQIIKIFINVLPNARSLSCDYFRRRTANVSVLTLRLKIGYCIFSSRRLHGNASRCANLIREWQKFLNVLYQWEILNGIALQPSEVW